MLATASPDGSAYRAFRSTENVPTLFAPSGARAEAIRALRTHIVAQHINLGRRALAVCATSAGVGCTFVSVNLAISLAQIGLHTLLIDGNLRGGGGVEEILGVEGTAETGLLQALTADEAIDPIQSNVLPNLSVIYSGGSTSSAQELLSDNRFVSLMGDCLRDFDVTIVDTPPASSYADARRISTVMGYSLIVVRKDQSLIRDLKTLAGELALDHARIVGTVLNED